ncbi:hypothetical protein B0H14DRAFT_3497594 [Mycena olivaceomarginata]|nr:hypothetical protein B0H14DRAFT_3497594 [Mycena olivaceomarginata]
MRHTSPSRWRHARADPTLPTTDGTLRKTKCTGEKTRERGRLPQHLGRCSQGPRALAHIVTVSACTSWQQGLGCTALARTRTRTRARTQTPLLFPRPLRRDLRPFPQTHPRPCHALAHNAEKGEVQGHLD